MTRELSTLADPDADVIALDGRVLPAPEAKHYLLLHKPGGVVTTVRDPQGRSVVTDLLPAGVRARVYPVGRLDADVEGLLLLTNDGALTHRLLHPRYGLPRVYEAEVEGRVTRDDLPRWRRGVALADGPAVPLGVEWLASSGGQQPRCSSPSARDASTRSSATARRSATGCAGCAASPSARSGSAICPWARAGRWRRAR